MSSYIIAGSSDNIDTAYCEEIANRIKAKYSNIDFRIIIKHPSEWEAHLQEVCRIYGFRNKSNPIIYTFDGKIIGDKQAFLRNTSKYFGIGEEDMNIGPLSTDVNRRLADEELRKKLKLKNKEKTLMESIDERIAERLKERVFVWKLLNYERSLESFLVFYRREVEGLCDPIKFIANRVVEARSEQVHPDEHLDVMAMSLQDQVPPPEEPHPIIVHGKEKEAFVTHQEDNPSGELRRSKTNGSIRLHESSVSHENQSKLSSKEHHHKTQVEEEFFEESLYYELVNIECFIISDFGDEFYLVLSQKPVVLGQLELVKIAPTEEGLFQMDYSKHPREQKGHPWKFIKAPTHQTIEDPTAGKEEQKEENEDNLSIENGGDKEKGEQDPKSLKDQDEPRLPSKTISIQEDRLLSHLEVHEEPEVELQSNINARLLNFLRPISLLQITKAMDVITKTSAVLAVHYSQVNPNPKMVIHLRKYLHEAFTNTKNCSDLLPVESTLMGLLESAEQITEGIFLVRELGFMHLVSRTPKSPQQISDTIKKQLQLLSQIEHHLNAEIGYNLILTEQYLLVVPLVDSYRTYNGQKLYLDGLAYIGVVHLAKVVSPFSVKKPENLKASDYLIKCSGTIDLAQHIRP